MLDFFDIDLLAVVMVTGTGGVFSFVTCLESAETAFFLVPPFWMLVAVVGLGWIPDALTVFDLGF